VAEQTSVIEPLLEHLLSAPHLADLTSRHVNSLDLEAKQQNSNHQHLQNAKSTGFAVRFSQTRKAAWNQKVSQDAPGRTCALGASEVLWRLLL